MKQKRAEKFTPVPDSLIADRLKMNTFGMGPEANPQLKFDPVAGQQSVLPGNLSALGDARRTILGLSLDHVEKTASNQSVMNKSGYLTQLGATNFVGDRDIHDFKKARLLFKSIVQSDPSQPRGWIGAARIEELEGKLDEARNIISQGVVQCEGSEDVWIEAIRLEPADTQKAMVTAAIQKVPKSVKLWMIAEWKETDKDRKIKVLKKALQMIPQSEKIWKRLIDLAKDDTDAIELLTSAIQCVPVRLSLIKDKVEFRLALARLLPYQEAKEVINVANNYFKNEERDIWIHASKLEEANGNSDKCEILISRGLRKIMKKKKLMNRDDVKFLLKFSGLTTRINVKRQDAWLLAKRS
jgi:pre-mRNA-processing factor 6